MKFDNKKLEITKNPFVWHKWFAWFPVKVSETYTKPIYLLNNYVKVYVKKTRWIWLENVWRKIHKGLPDLYDFRDPTWYVYKENINNEVPNG